jgi:hypothetical protein
MAGEITREAITLALGGAGIGAGGAVIAQIVAAIFTGRRENRRFKWEKQQTFRDDKREVFVSFIRLVERRHELFGDAAHGTEEDAASATEKVATSKEKWWEDFTEKAVEIRLLAPSLSSKINGVGALFAEWHHEIWSDGPVTGDHYKELPGRYRALVGELEPLMQSSLGLDAKGNIKDK